MRMDNGTTTSGMVGPGGAGAAHHGRPTTTSAGENGEECSYTYPITEYFQEGRSTSET